MSLAMSKSSLVVLDDASAERGTRHESEKWSRTELRQPMIICDVNEWPAAREPAPTYEAANRIPVRMPIGWSAAQGQRCVGVQVCGLF